MTKVLVLYHSIYGHIERMATAGAEGAREVAGTDVHVKRVPDSLSDDAIRKMGGRWNSRQRLQDPMSSRTMTRSSSEPRPDSAT